ncbi:hypothetical protein [Rathayibacter sp. AY1C5]|uniref:hypothetical protein n=1 Tax=Rathayibacter sp. AY1C5 TaxID=2080538 RepID=UPI000CE7BF03|nr:hypothetical protein [Rathayibacter sp. AY1C5]PPG61625.1 hypothetical protein C5C57_00925 [Rathayibacter sp. AY1C5]
MGRLVIGVVDVRHAGGAVLVELAEFLEQAVVCLKPPGLSLPLYPDEAVHLAVELIAAAHRAEHPAPDDWLGEDGRE